MNHLNQIQHSGDVRATVSGVLKNGQLVALDVPERLYDRFLSVRRDRQVHWTSQEALEAAQTFVERQELGQLTNEALEAFLDHMEGYLQSGREARTRAS